MGENLKPCPFCGGEGSVYQVLDYPEKIGPRFSVICNGCGASVTTTFQSEWTAIEAWNRRADRTCQIVVSVDRNPASYGGRVHRCSSCGKALPGALFRNGWRKLDYCPRCGAWVTEEVRDGD